MTILSTLGLSLAERTEYLRQMRTDYVATTQVSLLTLDRKAEQVLSDVTTDGQVNLSAEGIGRTLQLGVFDPSSSLNLDTGSPSGGALYHDRLIRVVKRVRLPDLAASVGVPLFTGPISRFQRSGSLIDLEGQGLEARALTDVATMVVRKGELVTTAIEEIMRERCGETYFRFPSNIRTRLPKDVMVGEAEELWPWVVCRKLARSIGCQLFYDGDGALRLRRINADPVWTFRADTDDATLTEPVSLSSDSSELYNRVKVRGKKGVVGLAQAHDNHPLSPWRLRRNGVPFRKTLFIEDDKIGSKAQANDVAERQLELYLTQTLALSFGAVPVYHLDVMDALRVETAELAANFMLRSASIPLGAGSMTVGFQRRVSKPAAKLRPGVRRRARTAA